jgi:hypothetical protein
MRWMRLRLTSLLWLVAIVAAFLGGVRYGEYRAAPRWRSITVYSTGGGQVLQELRFNVNSPDGAAAFDRHLSILRGMRSNYKVASVDRPLTGA